MPIGPDAIVRAVAADGGVVVLVDPQSVDLLGVQKLMDLLRSAPHKPAIKIVSKAYNPFAFGGALSGIGLLSGACLLSGDSWSSPVSGAAFTRMEMNCSSSLSQCTRFSPRSRLTPLPRKVEYPG